MMFLLMPHKTIGQFGYLNENNNITFEKDGSVREFVPIGNIFNNNDTYIIENGKLVYIQNKNRNSQKYLNSLKYSANNREKSIKLNSFGCSMSAVDKYKNWFEFYSSNYKTQLLKLGLYLTSIRPSIQNVTYKCIHFNDIEKILSICNQYFKSKEDLKTFGTKFTITDVDKKKYRISEFFNFIKDTYSERDYKREHTI